MKYTISVNPGIDFPKNLSDIIKNAILEADTGKVADWLESLPDEFFLSAFTPENRNLLARLLRGEIKKRKGLKPEKGFHDFLIFFYYKQLREQGHKRGVAIKKTAEAVRSATALPDNDLLRQAVEGRYWQDENIEGNIEDIIKKMEKVVTVEITPPKSF